MTTKSDVAHEPIDASVHDGVTTRAAGKVMPGAAPWPSSLPPRILANGRVANNDRDMIALAIDRYGHLDEQRASRWASECGQHMKRAIAAAVDFPKWPISKNSRAFLIDVRRRIESAGDSENLVDFNALSVFQRRRAISLIQETTGRAMWEFSEVGRGIIPCRWTREEFRHGIQVDIETWQRALQACLPVAERIPGILRGTFINALRLTGHWGDDDLRESTLFALGRKKLWVVEMLILDVTGRRVLDFAPPATAPLSTFLPLRPPGDYPPLPVGIFDEQGFHRYCNGLRAQATSRAATSSSLKAMWTIASPAVNPPAVPLPADAVHHESRASSPASTIAE